jgi:transcriptional regulator of acetoin/glycerol metabolism
VRHRDCQRSTIERVMNDMQGNISKAARTLGISRTQLYTRLRKYGFNPAGG